MLLNECLNVLGSKIGEITGHDVAFRKANLGDRGGLRHRNDDELRGRPGSPLRVRSGLRRGLIILYKQLHSFGKPGASTTVEICRFLLDKLDMKFRTHAWICDDSNRGHLSSRNWRDGSGSRQ